MYLLMQTSSKPGYYKNICVYWLLWLIVVHVILSNKIIRSYFLNDKNLTSLKNKSKIWKFQNQLLLDFLLTLEPFNSVIYAKSIFAWIGAQMIHGNKIGWIFDLWCFKNILAEVGRFHYIFFGNHMLSLCWDSTSTILTSMSLKGSVLALPRID